MVIGFPAYCRYQSEADCADLRWLGREGTGDSGVIDLSVIYFIPKDCRLGDAHSVVR
jgi:hypothetical protein